MNHQTSKNAQNSSFLANFSYAAIASAMVKTLSLPVQNVLVNKHILNSRGEPPIGFIDCATKMLREEGLHRFYRFFGRILFSSSLAMGLNFSIKDFYKQKIKHNRIYNDFSKQLITNIGLGGAAGSTTLLLMYPWHHPRIHIAAIPQKNNPYQMLRKYYKNFSIAWAGIFIYRGLTFGIYDSLKPKKDALFQNNLLASFVLGFISNAIAFLIGSPFENVKRMMAISNKYKSYMECFIEVFRASGIRPLFSMKYTSLLLPVSGGAILALYDKFQNSRMFMSKRKGQDVPLGINDQITYL